MLKIDSAYISLIFIRIYLNKIYIFFDFEQQQQPQYQKKEHNNIVIKYSFAPVNIFAENIRKGQQTKQHPHSECVKKELRKCPQ